MDTQKLSGQVKETETAIIGDLDRFSEEQLNIVPFEGSWTGGQVAEHLLKSAGVADVVFGHTAPTSRPPDEKVPMLRIFLDFSIKMKSPDFIIPSDGFHPKKPLIDGLRGRWQRMGEAVDKLAPSGARLYFETPQVARLTPCAWS